MSAAENKRRVRAMFDALEAGDRAGFWDELADDLTFTVMGTTSWSGTYIGKERVRRQLFKPLHQVLGKGPRTIVKRMLADEDVVVVEATGDNVTTAGARYDNRYCLLFRLAEGKVREIVEYSDTALMARVLGPRPAT
jgi:ketosteroid isomerase-like protein